MFPLVVNSNLTFYKNKISQGVSVFELLDQMKAFVIRCEFLKEMYIDFYSMGLC